MLQWGGLRERVIASGQGSVGRGQGRYLNDEFVLCYARNLVLEWGGKGRNLTGNAAGNAAGGGGLVQSNGTVMNGPGFDEGVFELGADGEVRLSEEFAKAVVGQDNWALRSEFFERYPELLDLARRATE